MRERCVRVNIYVNGIKIEDESCLEGLKASDVQFIDMLHNPKLLENENSSFSLKGADAWANDSEQVFEDEWGQSIHITTSRLNRGRFVESTPDLVHVVPLGYVEQAEFYAPKYLSAESREIVNSDKRSTIHWVPSLRLNEQGEAALTFYTADRPSTYTIVIEGVTTDGTACRYTRRIKGRRVL